MARAMSVVMRFRMMGERMVLGTTSREEGITLFHGLGRTEPALYRLATPTEKEAVSCQIHH